ncbi:MAG: ATP-binding protein [Bacteroidales bacterium]|nr:ATP-binding protein [Bacteroidales bacterium]
MITRALNNRVFEDLSAFRIINIKGARQCGKTTVVKQLAAEYGFKYFTFDNIQDLEYARKVPMEFVELADENTVVIDEIQMMPEILPYIKMQVDKKNRAGQFLITSSADLLKMAKVFESLAGRSVEYELMTLSIAEIYKIDVNIIDLLLSTDFREHFGNLKESGADVVFKHAAIGGFPEVQKLTVRQRKNWFSSYLRSRVIKDIEEISIGGLQKLEMLPKMLRYLSWQAGDLLNFSSVAVELGIDLKTVKSYIDFYDTLFIARILSPYFVNLSKRIVRTPKFYFNDSGLLAYFLNVDTLPDKKFNGKIIENFVFNELLKSNSTAQTSVDFYFFRDKSQYEVDFVLEYGQGDLIAVEVKAKESLKSSDFLGIRKLKRLSGLKLQKAFVFYLGSLIYPEKTEEGLDIIVLPISVLKGLK